jgi:hypothetical protein
MAYSYLRLGLPVLLIFAVPNVGLHGVALNGYSLRPTSQLAREGGSAILPRLVGLRIDEFYCHDDQAGPFSRLKIVEAPDDKSTVKFTATNWQGELAPYALVVPVNPKIRTGFREAITWIPRISALIGFVRNAPEFEWDIYLTRSNDLKKQVREDQTSIHTSLRPSFLTNGLPKHLWRCTLTIANAPTFEMLLDTTEMVRGFPIVRILWRDDALRQELDPVLRDPSIEPFLVPLLTKRLLDALRTSSPSN